MAKCIAALRLPHVLISFQMKVLRHATMIFDEIDTRFQAAPRAMGRMICDIGQYAGFGTTHLPQVAAKGDAHRRGKISGHYGIPWKEERIWKSPACFPASGLFLK